MIRNPAASTLTRGSESLILNRMTWNEAFKRYIEKRFPGDRPQQEAAFSLRTSPSNIHYWCTGTVPREKWRKKIATWSKGDVPAELQVSSVRRTGTDG